MDWLTGLKDIMGKTWARWTARTISIVVVVLSIVIVVSLTSLSTKMVISMVSGEDLFSSLEAEKCYVLSDAGQKPYLVNTCTGEWEKLD